MPRAIVLDPPWDYKDLGWNGHRGQRGYDVTPRYGLMRVSEIERLPIGEVLAAAGGGFVFLWITNPFLTFGLHTPILKAWGVRPVATVTWVKQGLPPGWDVRHTCEQFIVAKQGNHRTADRSLPTHIHAKARGHSVKPDEAYEWFERAIPEGWEKLDIFARVARPGWRAIGNEIDGQDIFDAISPFAGELALEAAD